MEEENKQEYKVGDIVALVSNPWNEKVIKKLEDGKAQCYWLDEDEPKLVWFPLDKIEPYDPPQIIS